MLNSNGINFILTVLKVFILMRRVNFELLTDGLLKVNCTFSTNCQLFL